MNIQFVEMKDTFNHRYIIHLNSSTVFYEGKEGLINIIYNNGSPLEHTANKYEKFRTNLINLSLLIQTQ